MPLEPIVRVEEDYLESSHTSIFEERLGESIKNLPLVLFRVHFFQRSLGSKDVLLGCETTWVQ